MSPNAEAPALECALRADAALAALDDVLIEAAQRLYRLGFTPGRISAAQLAAAGELIASATTFDQARGSLRYWLRHQLDRLEARAQRGAPPASWLLPPAFGEGVAESLGGELLRWVEGELYIPAEPPADLNRLAALQRFWSRFSGLYRYEAAVGVPMPLLAFAAEATPSGAAAESAPGAPR